MQAVVPTAYGVTAQKSGRPGYISLSANMRLSVVGFASFRRRGATSALEALPVQHNGRAVLCRERHLSAKCKRDWFDLLVT